MLQDLGGSFGGCGELERGSLAEPGAGDDERRAQALLRFGEDDHSGEHRLRTPERNPVLLGDGRSGTLAKNRRRLRELLRPERPSNESTDASRRTAGRDCNPRQGRRQARKHHLDVPAELRELDGPRRIVLEEPLREPQRPDV